MSPGNLPRRIQSPNAEDARLVWSASAAAGCTGAGSFATAARSSAGDGRSFEERPMC